MPYKNNKLISLLTAFSFLLANPVLAADFSALRPAAVVDRIPNGTTNVLVTKARLDILEDHSMATGICYLLSLPGVGLKAKEAEDLSQRILRFEYSAPGHNILTTHTSLLKLIAEAEGTTPGVVLRVALIRERVHNILNSLPPHELEAALKLLGAELEKRDPQFKKNYVKEYGPLPTYEIFGKKPLMLYLENVIAEYYSEKARFHGEEPVLFIGVKGAIEQTMELCSLSQQVLDKLPLYMVRVQDGRRMGPNFHELFDYNSGYTASAAFTTRDEIERHRLAIKYFQLTCVAKAAGAPLRVYNRTREAGTCATYRDIEDRIRRAQLGLRPILDRTVTYHHFLKASDGITPLKIAPLPAGYDQRTLDSDDIVKICDQLDIRFMTVAVLHPDTKKPVSMVVAPGRIDTLLKRGLTVDGSSLLKRSLLRIFGERLPTIGDSDIQIVLEPKTFCILQAEPGKPKEVYIEAKLVREAPLPRKVESSVSRPEFKEPSGQLDVERRIRQKNVTSVTLIYSDFKGEPNEYEIAAKDPDELVQKLRDYSSMGISFSGDVIRNCAGAHYLLETFSDIVVRPKFPTFRLVPMLTPQGKTYTRAIMVGQLEPHAPASKEPWQEVMGHPRNFLKAVSGYSTGEDTERYMLAPEIEFYLELPPDYPPSVIGYHQNFNGTPYEAALKAMMIALEDLGDPVRWVHAEVGTTEHAAQFEFVMDHGPAFKVATIKQMHKWVLTKIAETYGLKIKFQAKPYRKMAGDGMHVHISKRMRVSDTWKNMFFDPHRSGEFSETGRQFMAGIMKYLPEMDCFINQSDNSFERLVPGYEAPVYDAQGRRNRTCAIRWPPFRDPNGGDVRMEVRVPDSNGNIDLIFAMLIVAGEAGIREKLNLSDYYEAPLGTNLYTMSATEKAGKGISPLPGSFYEALYNASRSTFVAENVPPAILNYFGHLFQDKVELVVKKLNTSGIIIKQ
ncbi:MAG: glutamine synthetase family protein, partial [Candidatus Omnitrophica bacterium]|nr:glutamine synthetase family protein [Candidatus Omnitrophota bacterium]